MVLLRTWIVGCCCWLSVAAAAAEPLRVIYGSPISQRQLAEQTYPLNLLKEALRATGTDFVLQPAGRDMVQSRVLKEIAAGTVDIYWSMTSAEREQQLRPIRIPLDKGLNGWRLLLIASGDSPRFAKVHSLHALKKFTFVQGHDWPDTQVLNHNGLRVQTSAHPPQLMELLKKRRVDAFPRAVFEAVGDAEQAGNDIEVEPSLVLVYPSAVYFFVHPDNVQLAQRVEQGLRLLQKNGRFDQLFMQHYGAMLRRTALAGRSQIRLENPIAPATLPLQDASLWYRAGAE